jgi:arginine/lysine/histidine/glutamine transport system substrate-binding and permease protein
MARALAHQMGREAVLLQVDWSGIQAGLQAGKFDLICGSMAITPERAQSMQFSLPYYVSGAQVFRKASARPDERFGVTEDSTYARFLQEHPKQFPGASITRYGSEAEIVAAMQTDKIEAFISDRIVGRFYVRKGGAGNIHASGALLYQEACGISARSDQTQLIGTVNAALLALVQSGEYAQIYQRWVGDQPDFKVLFASWGEFSNLLPNSRAEDQKSGTAPGFAEKTSDMLPLLARGAWLTLQLSLITSFCSLITGALVGLATVSPSGWLRGLSRGSIGLLRGTPLLVQLFLSYFALATALNRILGFELLGAWGAALLALIVNTTAYNAETFRGGIQAVEKGQWDAAFSLGMTRAQTLRRVILPQALAGALPSLGNNLVVLIKDTSLVGAITLVELTYSARNVVFQSGQAFFPFLLAAAFYLVIISSISLAMGRWETHLNRSRHS